jgi:Methyltransferase domain
LADAKPMSQNTREGDLGFGWIYYGLIRNLRPEFVVAIGSCRGFMPFCAARAVKDNGSGTVVFIDPSYAGLGDPGWNGEGAWGDPDEVRARFSEFGLDGYITHLKATSAGAFPQVAEIVGAGSLGVVIVDGAHTFENSLQDFELYSSLMTEGFVVFHDSTNPVCDVSAAIAALSARGYPAVTFHRDVGLTIVEVRRDRSGGNYWEYLCAPSNRAAQILPHARAILRPGDSVFDVYCGCAPLAPLLEEVEIFGCDGDAQLIRELRARLPQHRWEHIDESWLPFAGSLPEEVDVLIGLGLSRGHASWDPRFVVENVRYLLGRYRPRACLFECATDYFDAEILSDLEPVIARLEYTIHGREIETDLESFARRTIMLAERL